jgi:non-specific serine/threonine protein kinase
MLGCCGSTNVLIDNDNESSCKVHIEKKYFNENNYNPTYLNKGSSCLTYKIKFRNIELTCKKIDKTLIDDINTEIHLLKLMSHENKFPVFFNAIEELDYYFILYNYIEGKDLFSIIDDEISIIEFKKYNNILKLIYQITSGLDSLFKYNYIHLDIKPENIIIENINPLKIKIIDLAFCQKINTETNILDNKRGTPGYSSPEMMLHKTYSHNSDIWSLGIIIYCLFNKYKLFNDNIREYTKHLKKYTDFFNWKYTVIIGIPGNILTLLNNMLVKNPNNRYTIKDILKDKSLKNIKD